MSDSILGRHLDSVKSSLSNSRGSSKASKASKSKGVGQKKAKAENDYAASARQAIEDKARRVKQYSEIVKLSQPKKSSRKKLKKLVKKLRAEGSSTN